jgi:hypothetical protein
VLPLYSPAAVIGYLKPCIAGGRMMMHTEGDTARLEVSRAGFVYRLLNASLLGLHVRQSIRVYLNARSCYINPPPQNKTKREVQELRIKTHRLSQSSVHLPLLNDNGAKIPFLKGNECIHDCRPGSRRVGASVELRYVVSVFDELETKLGERVREGVGVRRPCYREDVVGRTRGRIKVEVARFVSVNV